jgi:hypothetical protein
MESDLPKLFQSLFGISGVEKVEEFFRLLDDKKVNSRYVSNA